jgi:hypothetical protein
LAYLENRSSSCLILSVSSSDSNLPVIPAHVLVAPCACSRFLLMRNAAMDWNSMGVSFSYSSVSDQTRAAQGHELGRPRHEAAHLRSTQKQHHPEYYPTIGPQTFQNRLQPFRVLRPPPWRIMAINHILIYFFYDLIDSNPIIFPESGLLKSRKQFVFLVS